MSRTTPATKPKEATDGAYIDIIADVRPEEVVQIESNQWTREDYQILLASSMAGLALGLFVGYFRVQLQGTEELAADTTSKKKFLSSNKLKKLKFWKKH